jgi:hypothetical protein
VKNRLVRALSGFVQPFCVAVVFDQPEKKFADVRLLTKVNRNVAKSTSLDAHRVLKA